MFMDIVCSTIDPTSYQPFLYDSWHIRGILWFDSPRKDGVLVSANHKVWAEINRNTLGDTMGLWILLAGKIWFCPNCQVWCVQHPISQDVWVPSDSVWNSEGFSVLHLETSNSIFCSYSLFVQESTFWRHIVYQSYQNFSHKLREWDTGSLAQPYSKTISTLRTKRLL